MKTTATALRKTPLLAGCVGNHEFTRCCKHKRFFCFCVNEPKREVTFVAGFTDEMKDKRSLNRE